MCCQWLCVDIFQYGFRRFSAIMALIFSLKGSSAFGACPHIEFSPQLSICLILSTRKVSRKSVKKSTGQSVPPKHFARGPLCQSSVRTSRFPPVSTSAGSGFHSFPRAVRSRFCRGNCFSASFFLGKGVLRTWLPPRSLGNYDRPIPPPKASLLRRHRGSREGPRA